jgi:hypothetical protein
MTAAWFDVGLSAASRKVLRQVGDALEIAGSVDTIDAYGAATQLATNQRVDRWLVLDAIRATYADEAIPIGHLAGLAEQLEGWLGGYLAVDGDEERHLAIIRPEGFDRVEIDGDDVRQATISYQMDRAGLVWDTDRVGENPGDYGFHYVPYNFDSTPEADFYERILAQLNLRPDEVQDIYFTGAITDPRKTDLSFPYPKGDRDARYTPDFVIHAVGDRWMLVEVKMTARRDDPIEGRTGVKARALQRIEALNPGRVVYRMVFADAQVPAPDIEAIKSFLGETRTGTST